MVINIKYSTTDLKTKHQNYTACSIAIICFGITLRTVTSLYEFSGFNKPPMFGDFEAQRHWQEITVNIPIKEWYINSTKNDLQYWGLDYPPLTAYHSYMMGKIAETINSSYIELNTSRGFYSTEHKNFMRSTVLFTDLLIYFPAAILLLISLNSLKESDALLNFITSLYYPSLILIDYGHFQYNNISLGFALISICCILKGKDVLSSIFFCLALNYKQMELYHAIPIFIYLLRRSFLVKNKRISWDYMYFVKISTTVLMVFAILWLPWLFSLKHFTSVLSRLFPFNRGIFEDKVSNFWCILNVFIKIKTKLDTQEMILACLGTTTLSLLPSSIILFFHPTKENFLYALFNSSMGFFLFSYQVHEKSILLAALPALILINKEPLFSFWFLQMSGFSMIPLLYKDGLVLAFLGINLIFEGIYQIIINERSKIKYIRYISIVGSIVLTLLYIFGPISSRYPHIYDLAIASYCCVHFLMFLVYFNYKNCCKKL